MDQEKEREAMDAAWTEHSRKIEPMKADRADFVAGWIAGRTYDIDQRDDMSPVDAAYQIVGALAHYTGTFEHPDVQRALDYLSGEKVEDILPWPREAIMRVASTQREMEQLRAAIAPFARVAALYSAMPADSRPGGVDITVADLRRAAEAQQPSKDGGGDVVFEEAVRLAEVGEYLFNACRYSGGNGYTEPREMGIDWQWQQCAPEQYGEGMLIAATTKWHDEQAEDGIVTEARKLRQALFSAPALNPKD